MLFNHFYVQVSYPDFDAGASGSTQPVAVRAEAEGIDDITTVQGVQVLALIQVPQHSLAILLEKKNTNLDHKYFYVKSLTIYVTPQK